MVSEQTPQWGEHDHDPIAEVRRPESRHLLNPLAQFAELAHEALLLVDDLALYGGGRESGLLA